MGTVKLPNLVSSFEDATEGSNSGCLNTVCHTDAWCLPLFPPRPSGSMRAPSLCVDQLILAVEFEVLEVR